MHVAWNKGLTKENNASVRKIAATLRRKKIDNFAHWRTKARKAGVIPNTSVPLCRKGDLAELIGVVLGDGNITRFPRTECLRIVANAENMGFVHRYADIIEKVFGKKPHVSKRRHSNAVNITLYQCNISQRMGIPTGAKGYLTKVLPLWIIKRQEYRIRYLRGLYEAEGSYSTHAKTYTHKFSFSNTNPALLDAVYATVCGLGFHPHRSEYKIQVSRKAEVQKLMNLLQFRHYENTRSHCGVI